MQGAASRRKGARPGYHWDQATLEQRRRMRLQRLESENYTALPEFDRTLLDSKHLGDALRRKQRKQTRHLCAQKVNVDMARESRYLACVTSLAGAVPRHFCSVCGFWGTYTCVECGMRVCSLACKSTHGDTRCLKHVV